MDSKIGNKKEQVKKIIDEIVSITSSGALMQHFSGHGIESKTTEQYAAEIDALYSDPPSPEMVCPTCRGTRLQAGTAQNNYNQTTCETCHGTGSVEPYDDDIRKCPACDGSGIDVGIETTGCSCCNGTGKVPSPEPPEKVREEILDDEAIMEAIDDADEDYKVNHLSRRFDEFEENQMQNNRYTFVLKAQILKLQQAGWANTSELQAKIKELEEKQCLGAMNCAGISGMPAIDVIKDAKAEARQQALKEVGEWLDKVTPTKGCPQAVGYAIELLKSGVLPKE